MDYSPPTSNAQAGHDSGYLLCCHADRRCLHSFPTRRSSDLQFLLQNLTIQNNVIEACADFGVAKLLFLGSSCIYPKLAPQRSEEHTSELQSHVKLVCRLLLEKKKQR